MPPPAPRTLVMPRSDTGGVSDPSGLGNSDATARSRRFWLRFLRILAAAFAVLFVAVLGILRYIGVFGGNIRVIDPRLAYRSAQLTGRNLREELLRDRIRTVINLRGPEVTDGWYQNETGICRQLGVKHVDVAFSATHLPPPEQLGILVNALDHAPRPLLMHCMGGADRAGLASTLYRALEDRQPLDRAEASQLTWRYGHLKFTRTAAMDEFFTLYRGTAHGEDLRHWIQDRYPSVYAHAPKEIRH